MESFRECGIKPARYYGLFWRWHFLAALIVIPFVLWQSTTGTLYLWSQWWVDHAHPELRFVVPAQRVVPPSLQLLAALHSNAATAAAGPVGLAHVHGSPTGQSATAAAGGPRMLDMLISAGPRRSTAVILQDQRGLPYPIFVNPYTGHVLGALSAWQWLPGWTRSLHGGWPFGEPGSWMLELGDCWAIVMLLTGLYLWWPRGRRFPDFLIPRLTQGTRTALRDLHASVAVLFSAVFLLFLVSALPWTSFWGGQLLPRLETVIGQQSPAGFSTGGASMVQIMPAAKSLDHAIRDVRARNIQGMLDIRLSPWVGSRWWMANVYTLAPDHTVEADPSTGRIVSDYTNKQIPAIPRFVALGVHVHQGDFGALNLWLNTVFALSLIWLTITGTASWWFRRPQNSFAVPPKTATQQPRGLTVGAIVMCVALPIFGASVAVIGMANLLARNARPQIWSAKAS